MKKAMIVATVLLLSGCVVYPLGTGPYQDRAPAPTYDVVVAPPAWFWWWLLFAPGPGPGHGPRWR